jgi:lipooligosaccharide transport system permease protein
VSSWLAVFVVPVAVLIGTSFSMPLAALGARVADDRMFVTIFRFLIVPMFLFSGTFFPVGRLPLPFELAAYVTPIWHGVELCRMLTLGDVDVPAAAGHIAYLFAWTAVGFELARRAYRWRLLR